MKPENIIIHHSFTKDSETVSWGAIRDYHINRLGMREIGYHYGIELVGDEYEIFKGRMDNEVGAHCKQARMNYKSLGVLLTGNFDLIVPPKRAMHKLVRLVRSLIEVYNISIERIHPHHLFATYKTCPGKFFDFDEFIYDLQQVA